MQQVAFYDDEKIFIYFFVYSQMNYLSIFFF